MKRLDTDINAHVPVVVSQEQYQSDRKQGYAILEFSPAGKITLSNPRNPMTKIERDVPAVLMFRCMLCKFDALDQRYTDGPEGHERSGSTLIKEHIFRAQHSWPYAPFENPYGNVEDVTIEGIVDYTKEIE